MGGQGAQHRSLHGILHRARPGSDSQTLLERPSHPRPLPHRLPHQQGPRRDPGRRTAPHGLQWLRAGSEEIPLVLLKRPANLTAQEKLRLRDLLATTSAVSAPICSKNSSSTSGTTPLLFWAGQFLDGWCSLVMRSRLEPMKKVARMLALIANFCSTTSKPKSFSRAASSRTSTTKPKSP